MKRIKITNRYNWRTIKELIRIEYIHFIVTLSLLVLSNINSWSTYWLDQSMVSLWYSNLQSLGYGLLSNPQMMRENDINTIPRQNNLIWFIWLQYCTFCHLLMLNAYHSGTLINFISDESVPALFVLIIIWLANRI